MLMEKNRKRRYIKTLGNAQITHKHEIEVVIKLPFSLINNNLKIKRGKVIVKKKDKDKQHMETKHET